MGHQPMSTPHTTLPRWMFVMAFAATSGCFWTTTRREGDALRSDVREVQERLDRQQHDLDAEMKALRTSLHAAAGGLRRNTADLGADLAAFETEARQLRGRLTSLEQAIERERAERTASVSALEKRLAALEGPATAAVTADSLWQQGRAAFEAKRWADARDVFARLVAGFPGHVRADDAIYFRAEALRHEERWEAAIREYRRVFDEHSESPLADDALFRAGESARRLLHCTEARTYFHLLRDRYPRSNLAAAAERHEQAIKAQRRNRAKCRS
jgi:TolA-binding protein